MQPDSPKEPENFDRPVAYDANGNPLYARPQAPVEPPVVEPAPAAQTPPSAIHITRAVEPAAPEVSEEVRQKHQRSRRLFPHLNLSESEYVISAVRRHPIGLIIPLVIGVLLITLSLTVVLNYTAIIDQLNLSGALAEPGNVIAPLLLFTMLVALGMAVVYYVYVNNKFFLTNESVIQELQVSLFSKQEQTVSLANIEDASFSQTNILQYLFNYGSIRLSTEGDETTYRFTYVANPKRHIAILNNAVESFKNGRPFADQD